MKSTALLTAAVLSSQAYAQDVTAPFLMPNRTTSGVPGTLGSVISSSSSTNSQTSSSTTASSSSSLSSSSTIISDASSSDTSTCISSSSTSTETTSTETSSTPSSTTLGLNGTSTIPLGTGISTSTSTTTSSGTGITLAPSIIASGNGSGIIIGSFTLTPGGSAFTSGSISISLASSGIINIDGSTTSLPFASPTQSASSTSTNTASGTPDITSTMTTVPTGVSTELITSSGLTTNTWITTTKDDSTTIVPVIWCSDCGGAIVIWNFPPIPSVLFDWTSVFPKLPKFDLPCVKIFGIQVSGNCPDPETKDDSDDDDDGDDDDSSSSSSSTSSTSSSTQSCSAGTTTVSDCRVGCSILYSTIDTSISSTTVCYTTSCEQTVGCSLQPTTTTSVSTSSISGDSCPFSATESYDAVATYSALGMDLPAWMAYPLTYVFSTTDSNTATANSSISSTSSPVSSTSSFVANTTSSIASITSEAMPTLTGTVSGVGTSSGSTCASTTTFERCNGSGGRSFCATTSSCASWVGTATTTSTSSEEPPTTTSETPTPTPTPTTALTVHDPVCHNEDDFPGHADINPASVPQGASKFCGANKIDMTPDSDKISQNYQNIYAVNYLFEVEWIDGCVTSDNSQSVENPVGDEDWECSDLLQKTFNGCNNGGVGGYIDAGCLRYTFTGGLGDS